MCGCERLRHLLVYCLKSHPWATVAAPRNGLLLQNIVWHIHLILRCFMITPHRQQWRPPAGWQGPGGGHQHSNPGPHWRWHLLWCGLCHPHRCVLSKGLIQSCKVCIMLLWNAGKKSSRPSSSPSLLALLTRPMGKTLKP